MMAGGALGVALVTGATGFVGGEIVRELRRRGRPVRALLRSGSDARSVERTGALVVKGDLLDEASLGAAVEGVSTVFHCAGEIDGDPERIRLVNAEGTRRLARAASGAVKRLVLMSSIAVYGAGDLFDVDEDAPLSPSGAYSESKVSSERAAGEISAQGGFELAVLRPCQIYGAADTRFLPRILAMVRDPDLLIFGDGNVVCDLVHVTDVARAALLAEGVESLGGARARAYNVTDGTRTRLAALLAILRRAAGAKKKIRMVPDRLAPWILRAKSLARAAGTLGAVWRPYRAIRVADVTRHRHLDISRSRSELRYEPSIDPERGIAAAVAGLTP